SASGIGIPSLSPTRDEFRALAAEGNLVPVFAELPADLDTPLSAYLRLRPGPYAFLLESVEGGEVWARYSFLSADPLMVLTAKNGRLTLKRGSRLERLPDGNPLQAVRDLLGQFQPVAVPGLPRFQGGAVGYLAYDMVHHMERLPRTTEDDLGLPDAVFLFTDALRRAKEYIAAGDAYQIVLSRRLDCRLTGDPFTVYRALRTINPSPYLFFLRLGKVTIVGSSPEVLVRVEGGAVALRPIAG